MSQVGQAYSRYIPVNFVDFLQKSLFCWHQLFFDYVESLDNRSIFAVLNCMIQLGYYRPKFPCFYSIANERHAVQAEHPAVRNVDQFQ